MTVYLHIQRFTFVIIKSQVLKINDKTNQYYTAMKTSNT